MLLAVSILSVARRCGPFNSAVYRGPSSCHGQDRRRQMGPYIIATSMGCSLTAVWTAIVGVIA
jgi:hypothetical protein